MAGDWLDGVARELARGQSRREVLRRLGGSLAVLLVSARLTDTAAAQTTCPEGQTLCGKTCVDIQTDEKNCGACKRKCPKGTTCQGGECRCGSGQKLCGKKCASIETDVKNCGDCGRKCPKKTTCITGVCGGCKADPDCGSGRVCNSGQCTALPTCTPSCGAGQVCRNGACVLACTFELDGSSRPSSTPGPRGPSATGTVSFSTETTFNGQTLRLEQSAPPFGSQGQFSTTIAITLGGTSVLRVELTGGKDSPQVTTTYGPTFYQGIQQSQFTNNGSTLQGQIDGRTIVPLSLGGGPPNFNAIQFADGGPPPSVTVDPALVNAIRALWQQAEREAASCTPAPAGPAARPRNPPQSLDCLGEIAAAVYVNFACIAGVSVGCAAATLGIGICLAIGLASCLIAGERVRRRVLFGATCCPTKCNPGDEGSLFGADPACCAGHEVCMNPGSEDSGCCPETFFGCEGKACCDSRAGQTCHPGGICCNPGLTPCQGVCCAAGSCLEEGCCTAPNVTCGSLCCPPFSSCCGGQCCTGACCGGQCCAGECIGSTCCPSPNKPCGLTCCGNQCCNNVCCRKGESCDPATGACAVRCSAEFGTFACQNVPGFPACCPILFTCCGNEQCCGPGLQCCSDLGVYFCASTCLR